VEQTKGENMTTKRLLDCCFRPGQMDKAALLYAIRASEGRVLISETIAITQPLLNNVTNAELAASQGADILLINMFDSEHPQIQGMPADTQPEEVLHRLAQLTGRIIGVNLEAVDPNFARNHDDIWKMNPGARRRRKMRVSWWRWGLKSLYLPGIPIMA
jgi:hypothetical protein